MRKAYQPKKENHRRFKIGDERIAIVDGETHVQVVEAIHGTTIIWSTERVHAFPQAAPASDDSIVAMKATRENGWRDYNRHLQASKAVLRELARQGCEKVELASGLVVECAS